jgi:phosphoribosylformylglycinamidine synthase
MWQFIEAVDGMAWACEELDLPVVGGNVSFYNQTDGIDIYPTPVVGTLGFSPTMVANPPRLDRAVEGMGIWVLGPGPEGDFAASAFDRIINGELRGRPADVDGETARRVIAATAKLAEEGVPVLHDVSTGGLAVALTEIAIASGVGIQVEGLGAADLLDETPLRVVAVIDGELDTTVDAVRIGTVGRDTIDFGRAGAIGLLEATRIWRDALPRRMN